MSGRWGQVVLTLGFAGIIIIGVNDFLAALFTNDHTNAAGYFIHLAGISAIFAYTVYVRHQMALHRKRLALLHGAWNKVPCALALFRNGQILEIIGNPTLFGFFNKEGSGGELTGEEHEERIDSRGQSRCVDRYVVELPEYGCGEYVAEILFDVTKDAERTRRREDEYVGMFRVLVNMFEMKDPYSHGHSENVSNLAQELARAIGLGREEIEIIGRAALLHDIGKIVIPQEILNKATPLTPDEYKIIQAHSAVSADILASMDVFQQEAKIVRYHHAFFDGGGYPGGISSGDIPLGSRILAVADAFDAMTAGRSVRGRRSVAAALTVLENEKGRQFDPALVDMFVSLVNAGRTMKI